MQSICSLTFSISCYRSVVHVRTMFPAMAMEDKFHPLGEILNKTWAIYDKSWGSWAPGHEKRKYWIILAFYCRRLLITNTVCILFNWSPCALIAISSFFSLNEGANVSCNHTAWTLPDWHLIFHGVQRATRDRERQKRDTGNTLSNKLPAVLVTLGFLHSKIGGKAFASKSEGLRLIPESKLSCLTRTCIFSYVIVPLLVPPD